MEGLAQVCADGLPNYGPRMLVYILFDVSFVRDQFDLPALAPAGLLQAEGERL